MRDVLDRVLGWLGEGRDVALATVVEVVRKAPRDPGTSMAVSDTGEIAGSVSGGCVEPAVVEVAREVLKTGRPRLVTFGISDDDAFEVGLSCGGVIHVWVEAVRGQAYLAKNRLGPSHETGPSGDVVAWRPLLAELKAALEAGRAVALVRVLNPGQERTGVRPGAALLVYEAAGGRTAPSGAGMAGTSDSPGPASSSGSSGSPSPGAAGWSPSGFAGSSGPAGSTGSSGDPVLDAELAARARQRLALGTTARETVAGADVFVHVFTPPPVLYIIGAVHPAPALAEAGRFLGYRVVVCDPRSPFATPERIPAAHQIVRRWPDEYLDSVSLTPRDAVCVLTHDLKFDVPSLLAALRTPVGYIGVMGSRRTHERRVGALREAGVTEEQLRRLHAPIGLEIGARTAEEMAIAIMAEIVASRNRAAGTRIPVTT